jgi:SET family sugar efflux transporter-like MFS transporter
MLRLFKMHGLSPAGPDTRLATGTLQAAVREFGIKWFVVLSWNRYGYSVSAAPQNTGPSATAEPPARGSSRIASLAQAREIAPLAGAIGAYGIVTAFLSTTTSLFLADAVRAAPLLIGLFFAARGAVAIVVSLVAGSMSDRLPDRRRLIVLAGVTGALGGLAFAVLRNYVAVLVTGAVFFAVGDVSFPQVFAYANEFAQARGRAVTAFTSMIRSVFSASWVVGPPVGFYLLAHYGFGPLYLAAGGLSLAIAVLGRWGLSRIPVPPRPAAPASSGRGRAGRGLPSLLLTLPWRTWLLLGAVIGLALVDQMYNIDIALYVTKDLHIGAQLVGWMAGLGAALEIPIMIIVGRYADRFGKLRVVLTATVGATVFFCLLPLARSAPPLLALQLLNAAWTAVALSIPVAMVQQEAPAGAGAASALYSSAFMFAVLLAGAITGVTATAIGFGNVFWVCAAFSVISGGLLLARAAWTPHETSTSR